jgi:probable HAF family extracellular repeat protein
VDLHPDTARELAGVLVRGNRAQRSAVVPDFYRATNDGRIASNAAFAFALLGYARAVEAGANPDEALGAVFTDPRVAAAAARFIELFVPIVERCGLTFDAPTARTVATLTTGASELQARAEVPPVAADANRALLGFFAAAANGLEAYAVAVAAGQSEFEAQAALISEVAPTGSAAEALIRGLLESCGIDVGLSTVSAKRALSAAGCEQVFVWYDATAERLSEYNAQLREFNVNLLEGGIALPGNLGAVDLNGAFLLEDGVFTPLPNVPGAVATVHLRINNRGQVLGWYVNGVAQLSGFIMDRGAITTIHVPGSMATVPTGINDRDQVVGGYVEPGATVDPVSGELGPVRGFRWDRGVFTRIDFANAATTAPYDINNRGQIVGNYGDADGVQHGFLFHRGVFTSIDHPLATRAPGLTATRLVGINDSGRIVGSYGDDAQRIDAQRIHAFVRDTKGDFTTVDPPRTAGLGAEASGINDFGQIVGRYLDATPTMHGFLKDRRGFMTLHGPGNARCDTAAFDNNDRGQILIPQTGTIDGSTCPQEGGE